jgi:hypothetical protein
MREMYGVKKCDREWEYNWKPIRYRGMGRREAAGYATARPCESPPVYRGVIASYFMK